MNYKSSIFIIFLILSSCAGYQIRRSSNPFEQEGIRSVSIPVFINKSSIPNVSGIFTKKIVSLMQDFPDLKIYAGENKRADALLIGIIHSPDKNQEIFRRGNEIFTSPGLENSTGGRPAFFVPINTTYGVSFQLILIKRPTKEEKTLLTSELGRSLRRYPNPKVIFNREFSYTASFNRQIRETTGPDSSGITNSVQSQYFFENSLESVASNVAQDVKELLFNVF